MKVSAGYRLSLIDNEQYAYVNCTISSCPACKAAQVYFSVATREAVIQLIIQVGIQGVKYYISQLGWDHSVISEAD